MTRPEKLSLGSFELQPFVRIKRREIVEEDLVAGFLRRLEVDGVDFDQGEVALAFFGRPDLAGDGVARAQIEAANLRGRDVNVIGAWQVVVFGCAQKAEAIGQAFENAFGEDQPALFGLRLENLKNEFLFAKAGCPGHAQIFSSLVEGLDTHILQLDQIERGGAVSLALRAGIAN